MNTDASYIDLDAKLNRTVGKVHNIIITGAREMGKTTLVKNIANKLIQLHNIEDKNVLIMANKDNYLDFPNATRVFEDNVKLLTLKDPDNKPLLIIIDDFIIMDFKLIDQDKLLKAIVLNSRHKNIYVIFSKTDSLGYNPIIRNQFDLVFSLFGCVHVKRYEYRNFFEFFKNFDAFNDYIKNMPQYTSFVLDSYLLDCKNKNKNTNTNDNDIYGYYKA